MIYKYIYDIFISYVKQNIVKYVERSVIINGSTTVTLNPKLNVEKKHINGFPFGQSC